MSTRREALAAAGGALTAAAVGAPEAEAAARRRRRRKRPAGVGTGGTPMALAGIAALAKTTGRGEPIAFVDLPAVDGNCEQILAWARDHKIKWRPAAKTLESPELLRYVVDKLDAPRVLVHHLRTVPQYMRTLPAGTDWLMGYPPTLGELEAYLTTPPARGEKPYVLRILLDCLELVRAAEALSRGSARPLPVRVALEIENGSPRGGLQLGAELDQALAIIKAAKGRLKLEALFCYDVLAAADGDQGNRGTWANYCQGRLTAARAQVAATLSGLVDPAKLILNGPGSANYRNWTQGVATEISPGSAVLYANYLDEGGYDIAGLRKALYLCAPVLRVGSSAVAGVPQTSTPTQFCFIKAGGWPTGNRAVLSKIVYPEGIQDEPLYSRGANSSGMVIAPRGRLALGDYVVETPRQVMEGQDYFAALHAVRGGRVRAKWPVLERWTGERDELRRH